MKRLAVLALVLFATGAYAAVCDGGDPPVCCDLQQPCPWPCNDGSTIPCPPKPKPNESVEFSSSGECPASPGDIEGQIRCGELECPNHVLHAWNTGSSCYARPGFLCCGRTVRINSTESKVKWPVTMILRPNGHGFNGESGRVILVSAETGNTLLQGHYSARFGEFYWDNGFTSVLERECK